MPLLASMGTAHMHIAILNMYYTAHPGTADTAMHHTCVPTHKYNKQIQKSFNIYVHSYSCSVLLKIFCFLFFFVIFENVELCLDVWES